MVFNHKSRSLFTRLMISYSIILALVMAMMYPIYLNTMQIVKEQAVKDSRTTIEKGLNTFETLLQGLDQTVFKLYSNPEISLISRADPVSIKDTLQILEAQTYMNAVFSPYDILQNAFVVFDKNQSVFTTNRYYYTVDSFYEYELNQNGKSAEQWASEILGRSHNRDLLPEEEINNRDTGRQSVLPYLISLPLNSNKSTGCVGVLIDKKKLLQLFLSNDVDSGGWLYLADEQGNRLMTWNYGGSVLTLDSSGYREMTIGGQKTVTVFQTGANPGIQVVAGIPERVFENKVNQVRRWILLFFGLALLAGLVISTIFAYRNSNPFRRLLSHIDGIGIKLTGGKNVFDSLEGTVDQLYASKQLLQTELANQKQIARSGVLDRLLRNEVLTAYDIGLAGEYFPDMPPSYCVVLADISRQGADKRENGTADSREFYMVVLSNIIKEEFPDKTIIHPIGVYGLVFILPQPKDRTKEYVRNRLITIQKRFKREYPGDILFGVSSSYGDILSLGKAYNEAQRALRLGGVEECAVFYEEPDIDVEGLAFDFYEGQKLFQLLLAGEKESVTALLDECVSRNMKVMKADSRAAEQLFYLLRGIIVSAGSELKYITASFEIRNYTDDIQVEALFESIEKGCVHICDEIDRRKRSHNDGLKESMIRYILKHYSDPDICANTLATEFGVTEKYVYNFIKEQTGMSFGDYLSGIRMENAVRLMMESRRSVSQIASDVGFLSQNTFYKAFKRVYGTSPSTWKSKVTSHD